MLFLKSLFILRRFNPEEMHTSDLRRVLSLLDLIALGAFAVLGVGLYVLAGMISRNEAGPAALLSFMIASFSSILSGICYAEFAFRVPRAGSAYIYSYVTVGELIAFVIGWNLILEYIIGASSVGRALVGYVDALPFMNRTMTNWMTEIVPLNVPLLAPFPDPIAFAALVLLSCLIGYGVKQSAMLNNVFSFVNFATIVTVIVGGSFYSNPGNWNIAKSSIPKRDDVEGGEGGFLPFGWMGVLRGAAICFYAFVGFDAVATTGEEANNPQRNIPLALVISLTVISLAYFGVTTVLTMMVPYYEQDVYAPMPHAFHTVGAPGIAWAVSLGAIFALCTSMLGAMFPLPRIIYSMAADGLIFRFLAHINSWTQTPLIATMIAGLIAGLMAAMFDLEELVDMMSLGTLAAYTIVAICVLILRYEHPDRDKPDYAGAGEAAKLRTGCLRCVDLLLNVSRRRYPSVASSHVTKWTVGIFSLAEVSLCITVALGAPKYPTNGYITIAFTSLFGAIVLLCFLILCLQPTATEHLTFKVPLVPLVPVISILINTYLMMLLSPNTWIRFAVWMTVGFVIYFGYGVAHSVERQRMKALARGETVAN